MLRGCLSRQGVQSIRPTSSAVPISPFDDCPSLFQEFLLTDATRTAIQEFANRYGLLGAPRQFFISVAGTASHELCAGELFEDWQQEIKAMSYVATMREKLQSGAIRPYQTAPFTFPPFQGRAPFSVRLQGSNTVERRGGNVDLGPEKYWKCSGRTANAGGI
jgi:hypothetical protein